MSLNADTLIDRSYLKGQIAKWRVIAILVVVLSVVLMLERFAPIAPHGDYVARVSIEGMIDDNIQRDELFKDLEEDDGVKAVILRVDSPGGTVVGGEQLFLNVQHLATIKPVVVVMRNLAASAAYMASVPAHRIYASKGTLTGSIGVIMQAAEFSEMAQKLGIHPITLKSGPNKAVPSPFEKMTDEQRGTLEIVVMDFYDTFVTMVAEGRKMDRAEVLKLADGRVFTGVQAAENGLVDAIGGEKEALEWLITEHQLKADITIEDRLPKKPKPESVRELFGQMIGNLGIFPQIQLDGLLSIWQPKPM